MFEARKLSCVRGKRLLFSDLSFTVKAGEALHIKGENGSGKSSLIKLLVGLAEPESGEVIWQGRSLNEDSYDFYRQLLFIGHKVGMNTHLSAEQNLDWYCQRQGIAFPDETKAEVFRTWSLYGFEDLPARQLSAGQQRKIALCRLMLEKKPCGFLMSPWCHSIRRVWIYFLPCWARICKLAAWLCLRAIRICHRSIRQSGSCH